jgi:ammonium transporter Rh
VILDVHMMLFGGFGFLMTFLKRHGFSAIALTMMITVVVTEWSILCAGFTRMDSTFQIQIKFEE